MSKVLFVCLNIWSGIISEKEHVKLQKKQTEFTQPVTVSLSCEKANFIYCEFVVTQLLVLVDSPAP